ncbi:MAG: hypothetical protein ACJ8C4_09585 [Gemmataceae bacterium]
MTDEQRAFLGAVESLSGLEHVWGRLRWQDSRTGRIVAVPLAGPNVAPLSDPDSLSAAERDTLALFQPDSELTRQQVRQALDDHGTSTVDHALARHVREGRLIRVGRKGPYRLP